MSIFLLSNTSNKTSRGKSRLRNTDIMFAAGIQTIILNYPHLSSETNEKRRDVPGRRVRRAVGNAIKN